jgi:argininosuccinate lyase
MSCLGSAPSSTTFDIDRHEVAAISRSTDHGEQHASASRFLAGLALVSSRRCICRASAKARLVEPGFGFVELDDAFTTGSSMMQKKKNPDAAELVAARAHASSATWSRSSRSGPPLGIAASFRRQDADQPMPWRPSPSLEALAKGRHRDLPSGPHAGRPTEVLTATEVADFWRSVPEAHGISGKLGRSDGAGVTLAELDRRHARFHPLDEKVLEVLDPEVAIEQRAGSAHPPPPRSGGPATAREALRRWSCRRWADFRDAGFSG